MDKKRTTLLLILILSLVAVVILMIGLPGLNLKGGEPLALDLQVVIPVPGGDVILPGGNIFFWIMRGLIALVLISLPIFIVYSLFTPQGRRQLLTLAIILIVTVFLLDRISRSVQNQPKELPAPNVEVAPEQPSNTNSSGVPPEQFEAKTPEWLTWTVSIGVAVLLTGIIGLVFWLYYKRNLKRLSPVDRLAREAQKAATAIQEGGDFKNTIIRCYYQMSQIIYSERGIRRDQAMTPSEFVLALEEKGFPGEPIQFLTRIFEDVRYGTKQPEKREEEKAVWYLTVIADASKNVRPI